jgi:hypothetical protein
MLNEQEFSINLTLQAPALIYAVPGDTASVPILGTRWGRMLQSLYPRGDSTQCPPRKGPGGLQSRPDTEMKR